MNEPRLLVLCDAPTVDAKHCAQPLPTGFARVAFELLSRWRPFFADIDVHGINYDGAPHELPFRIWRAGYPWYEAGPLQRFLQAAVEPVPGRRSASGEPVFYTHVWILQDAPLLSRVNFPQALEASARRMAAAGREFRSFLYYPADAPYRAEFMGIVRAVDVPVAYTEYGRRETERWVADREIQVLPHGVDTREFFPLPLARREIRRQIFDPAICKWGGFECWDENDFLMLNVNVNQRRKGIPQSLAVLARLKWLAEARGSKRRFKLLLHMREDMPDEGTDLIPVAEALGLERGVDWQVTGKKLFHGTVGKLSNASLNMMYNAADLYLTTSLGEGWGLGITEALAAGTPVAVPDHTACVEIFDRCHGFLLAATASCAKDLREVGCLGCVLPLSNVPLVNMLDNSVVRWPVDPAAAALDIFTLAEPIERYRRPLPPAMREWLNWDRIAGEWLKLFGVGETIEARRKREAQERDRAFAEMERAALSLAHEPICSNRTDDNPIASAARSVLAQ